MRQLEMASAAVLGFLIVALLCGGSTGSLHIVGDDFGWELPGSDVVFNYTAWAEKQVFVVGDTLQFVYASRDHNVQEMLDEQSFASCNFTKATVPALEGGLNGVTLSAEGTKWYVCGRELNCERGMKVKITVVSEAAAPHYNIIDINDKPSVFADNGHRSPPGQRVEGGYARAPTGSTLGVTPRRAPSSTPPGGNSETGAASSVAVSSGSSALALVVVVLALFV